jgi:hypothetical protein
MILNEELFNIRHIREHHISMAKEINIIRSYDWEDSRCERKKKDLDNVYLNFVI